MKEKRIHNIQPVLLWVCCFNTNWP